MKRSIIPLIIAAFILLAACEQKPSSVTKISGTVPEGDTIENVEILTWEKKTPDSVAARFIFVPVTDGRFEAEIPTCTSELSNVRNGRTIVQFVADGYPITVNMGAENAVSSKRKSINNQLMTYRSSQEALIDMMDKKAASLKPRHKAGEDIRAEALSLQHEYDSLYKLLIVNAVKNNPDNVVAAVAIEDLDKTDTETFSYCLGFLSEGMSHNTTISSRIARQDALRQVGIGRKFLDFEVVQDPEHPEASTVRLSDYVGKGKYILADFWASWCGPCRADIPVLKYIYEKYRGERFEIVGIAVHDQPEATLAAAEELDIPWPLILNANTPQTKLYGINGIPHTILFDPDGIILAKDLHGHALDAVLEKYLE